MNRELAIDLAVRAAIPQREWDDMRAGYRIPKNAVHFYWTPIVQAFRDLMLTEMG